MNNATADNRKEFLHQQMESYHLSEEQEGQLLSYYDLLVEANEHMNLTAITEFAEVIDKHFIDSFTLQKVFSFMDHFSSANDGLTMIDVGTGAGIPGIPLKIMYPNWNVILADSLQKRTNFLQQTTDALQLTGVTAVHGRAEDLGRQAGYRDHYDLCVARAVSRMSVLAELCLPFVRVGGYFVAFKGADIQQELEEAKTAIFLLGGKIRHIETFTLTGNDGEEYGRSLVVIEKMQATPKKYPRKAGTPAKDPLHA